MLDCRRMISFVILSIIFFVFIFLVVAPNRHIDGTDGFDYLQMALNLADGNGFASSHIYLHQANWFYKLGINIRDVNAVPILYRFPLPIVIEAAFIRLGFSPYFAAQLFSTLGCLLSGFIFFLIILRFSHSWGASLALTLAFLISEATVQFAISGVTEPLSTFFFLSLLLVLASPKSPYLRSLVAGLLCGLAYLNRTNSIFIMLPSLFIGIAWLHEEKVFNVKRSVLIYFESIIIFILVISPWLYHNYILSGSPFFNFTNAVNLLNGMVNAPSFARYYSMGTVDFITLYAPFILKKVVLNFFSGICNMRILLVINKLILLPSLMGMVLVYIYKPPLSVDLEFGWFKGMAIMWVAACFFNLAGSSFAWGQLPRFYAALWPMILLFAFAGTLFFLNYLKRIIKKYIKVEMSETATKLMAGIITGFLYVILNPPLLHPGNVSGTRPWETVQAARKSRAIFCGANTKGAIVSDVSDVLAVELRGCKILMCRYRSDSISPGPASFKEWDKLVDVSAFFISREALEYMPQEDRSFLAEKEMNYPHTMVLEDGSKIYFND